jgi:hypothetical protein
MSTTTHPAISGARPLDARAGSCTGVAPAMQPADLLPFSCPGLQRTVRLA